MTNYGIYKYMYKCPSGTVGGNRKRPLAGSLAVVTPLRPFSFFVLYFKTTSNKDQTATMADGQSSGLINNNITRATEELLILSVEELVAATHLN